MVEKISHLFSAFYILDNMVVPLQAFLSMGKDLDMFSIQELFRNQGSGAI